jgi:hypothetical protein
MYGPSILMGLLCWQRKAASHGDRSEYVMSNSFTYFEDSIRIERNDINASHLGENIHTNGNGGSVQMAIIRQSKRRS